LSILSRLGYATILVVSESRCTVPLKRAMRFSSGGEKVSDYYAYLDSQVNDLLNIDIGFNNLLGSSLYCLDSHILNCFFDRYYLIKKFQNITLSLFNASLLNEFDPEVASLVINELPDHMAYNYHRRLAESNIQTNKTPFYFRTDQVADGKIIEIQCPGSAWGLYEQLHHFFTDHGSSFGKITNFSRRLSENFASSLTKRLGKEAAIHHLLDNASIPYCVRFFIQKTRRQHVRYFGYDRDVTPYNCNFIRGHAFAGLWSDNFASRRISAWTRGLLEYDLPPSILFDEKISIVFPFWEKTMKYFGDDIREMFPYTQLITPEGFYLEDGSRMTISQFCRLSQKQRNYFVKYAGSDLDLNWGSKGVHFLGMYSRVKCEELFRALLEGYNLRKYWIIQKAHPITDKMGYFTRDKKLVEANLHTKFSGFYGPDGLMGILVMLRPFSKVHGSINTVLTVCK